MCCVYAAVNSLLSVVCSQTNCGCTWEVSVISSTWSLIRQTNVFCLVSKEPFLSLVLILLDNKRKNIVCILCMYFSARPFFFYNIMSV